MRIANNRTDFAKYFCFPPVLFASDLIADVKTAAESHVKPSTSLISASEIDQCSLGIAT